MNPPRELMRLVRGTGGEIVTCLTRFDRDRGGRVMVLTAFWPDDTGYIDRESSWVPPANETGSPARSEGAGSDQRRGHIRRSAPRA